MRGMLYVLAEQFGITPLFLNSELLSNHIKFLLTHYLFCYKLVYALHDAISPGIVQRTEL